MKHRRRTAKLSRTTGHRKSLMRNLMTDLMKYGRITTTKAKAKALKSVCDKLMYKAQKDTVKARRELHEFFGKRAVVNTMVDRIAPMFTERHSGFTTYRSLGNRRGDNAELFEVELVKTDAVNGTLKSDESIEKKNKDTKK